MSYIQVGGAIDYSQAKRSDKLVLLIISDHVNTELGFAWPTIDWISERTGLSTTQVTSSIKSLVKLGELEVLKNYDHDQQKKRIPPIINGKPTCAGPRRNVYFVKVRKRKKKSEK